MRFLIAAPPPLRRGPMRRHSCAVDDVVVSGPAVHPDRPGPAPHQPVAGARAATGGPDAKQDVFVPSRSELQGPRHGPGRSSRVRRVRSPTAGNVEPGAQRRVGWLRTRGRASGPPGVHPAHHVVVPDPSRTPHDAVSGATRDPVSRTPRCKQWEGRLSRRGSVVPRCVDSAQASRGSPGQWCRPAVPSVSTRRLTGPARGRLPRIKSRGIVEVDASASCIDGTHGADDPRHGGICARPQSAHPMARPGREWARCPSTDDRPRPERPSPGTGPPADRWWSSARDRRRVRSARCPADAPRGRLTPRHRARRPRRRAISSRAPTRTRSTHVTTAVS